MVQALPTAIMKKPSKIEEKSILQLVWNFVQTHKQNHFTFYELMDVLQERSFGILLLLMALPNALMISAIPGVSFFFGIILMSISLQMIQSRKTLWVPRRLGYKSFSKESLESILTTSQSYLYPIEKHLKSRWGLLTSNYFERFIGVVCLFHSILIVLPIPLGNFLPGIALIFISLGLLAKDGIYVFIGLILSLATFIFFAFAFKGIAMVIQELIRIIPS